MINLIKAKEKQKEAAQNAESKSQVKQQLASVLRVQRDISELTLPPICTIEFPNGKDDIMNFEVTLKPVDGYYYDGAFPFSIEVPLTYPHDAPKIKSKIEVYHPNIDYEGNVCLNILREDWKPILNINTVIYGLIHLFTEPNHEDPLNTEAANELRDNPKVFESNVRDAMFGYTVHGLRYHETRITPYDDMPGWG